MLATHPITLFTMGQLARMLCIQGKGAEAKALYGMPGPTNHHGIKCDLCDVHPIVGVRYISTTRPDYDLCNACRASPQAEAAGPYEAVGHSSGAL